MTYSSVLLSPVLCYRMKNRLDSAEWGDTSPSIEVASTPRLAQIALVANPSRSVLIMLVASMQKPVLYLVALIFFVSVSLHLVHPYWLYGNSTWNEYLLPVDPGNITQPGTGILPRPPHVLAHPYHLLLPVDKPNPAFCRTVSTFLLNGWDPNAVIFAKGDITEGSSVKLAKVFSVLRYLEREELGEEDVVIQLDSMDVWAQRSPAETLETYVS
jgi:hypothetical protein